MSRRLRKREFGIDADRILPGLYQGGRPTVDRTMTPAPLYQAGFDCLVLAAMEFQPSAEAYPGIDVCYIPFDDQEGRISRRQWRKIVVAAEWVAESVSQGKRVLVTCQMGINRSGLVTALAVMMLTGCSGERAVEHVRAKRRGALSNRSFAAHVMAVRV